MSRDYDSISRDYDSILGEYDGISRDNDGISRDYDSILRPTLNGSPSEIVNLRPLSEGGGWGWALVGLGSLGEFAH